MDSNVYAFELKSKSSKLKTLRQHLNRFAQVIGLSQNCLLEVNIVLDELFTNVVSYGFEDDLEHEVSFTLQIDHETLIISVEDDGRPFNPLEAQVPKIPLDPADIKIGGLGIFITRELMDEIHYKREDGKNKLTLMRKIRVDQIDTV